MHLKWSHNLSREIDKDAIFKEIWIEERVSLPGGNEVKEQSKT